MTTTIIFRRTLLALSLVGCGAVGAGDEAFGQSNRETRNGLTKPVYRVSNNAQAPSSAVAQVGHTFPAQGPPATQAPPQQAPPQQIAAAPAPRAQQPPAGHPLDPALKIAHDGLKNIQANVTDYTATLVKRERINGTLGEQEFMEVKIRNRKVSNGRVTTPLSAYLKFLRPTSKSGREVIYVEGQNNNKLLGHEVPGIRNLITAKLDPTGYFAMMGNRYPLTEIGIENLITKLIEKGERDRAHGEVQVQFFKGAKINDRVCTLLQVTHPEARPHFDFHVAQIFIDDELQVPVRYAAYSWPKTPGGKPVLEEEYTYMNINLNVGLTDADFDPQNKNYKFP